jgi:CDP-diacylglycerol pyrophosphatase
MSRRSFSAPAAAPEHWRLDAEDADVALLDIPLVSDRVRRFDVDVSFVVRAPDDAATVAWHELSVELDGRRQWSRRIATSNPGEQDSLDYHVRVSVDSGAPLRVRALTQVRASVRQRLLIEATEA